MGTYRQTKYITTHHIPPPTTTFTNPITQPKPYAYIPFYSIPFHYFVSYVQYVCMMLVSTFTSALPPPLSPSLTLTVGHPTERHCKVGTSVEVVQGPGVAAQEGPLAEPKVKLLLLSCPI